MLRIGVVLVAAFTAIAAPQAASAAGIGSLYSCDTAGRSDTTGAVVGGILGGLAGSQISKNERTLGAVAGAAIGAAIGNNIGCRMNRQARDRAQTAFERALETGRAQTWADEESGAYGRVEVVGGPRERRRGRSDEYEAINRANVRERPNINAAIVDRLQLGERIRTGAPINGWLPVLEGGEVQGYVSTAAVRPSYGDAGDDCRVVQQTVTARGYAPETQRYSACRDEGGGWRVTAI